MELNELHEMFEAAETHIEEDMVNEMSESEEILSLSDDELDGLVALDEEDDTFGLGEVDNDDNIIINNLDIVE